MDLVDVVIWSQISYLSQGSHTCWVHLLLTPHRLDSPTTTVLCHKVLPCQIYGPSRDQPASMTKRCRQKKDGPFTSIWDISKGSPKFQSPEWLGSAKPLLRLNNHLTFLSAHLCFPNSVVAFNICSYIFFGVSFLKKWSLTNVVPENTVQ